MQKAEQGGRYVVVDDFLPARVLARLREDAETAAYRDVDSVVDPRIDGTARRSHGGTLGWADRVPGEGLGQALALVNESIGAHPQIYGTAGADWNRLSHALWQYPAGARLGWHNDAGNGRTGEFILYLHERWRPSWGGELVVLDACSPVDVHGFSAPERLATIEDVVAGHRSPWTAIYPRPNRLVMVRAGTCHCINRVDVAAGSAIRRSLTGFASRPAPLSTKVDRAARLDALLG